jgi:hypothetical protein
MRQKKERRAPGHSLDTPWGTSVLTGNIAEKKIGQTNKETNDSSISPRVAYFLHQLIFLVDLNRKTTAVLSLWPHPLDEECQTNFDPTNHPVNGI